MMNRLVWLKGGLGFLMMNGSVNINVYADTIDTSGQAAYEQCGYCHEYDGNSIMPMYPRLAGQTLAYLRKQLMDFRAGRRTGQMQATAELLSDEDIQTVAEYFSQQTVATSKVKNSTAAQRNMAERLFNSGDTQRGLVACSSCHGKRAEGAEEIPRLAGQHETYLVKQLESFRSGERMNDANGQMQDISRRLKIPEIVALARYMSGIDTNDRAAAAPPRLIYD